MESRNVVTAPGASESNDRIAIEYGCVVLRPQFAVYFPPETSRERVIRGFYQAREVAIGISLRAAFILSIALVARWVIHG